MKKNKNLFEDDISIDAYQQKKIELFQEEFEEELNRSDINENLLSFEINHIQNIIISEKLSPIHKQAIEEWREIYPNEFNDFCNHLNDDCRQKLRHFLHLSDEQL